MPTIFDNISAKLLPALVETLKLSKRADFCVGYFNLRGWSALSPYVDDWDGSVDGRCRVLVGMHAVPQDDLRSLFSPRNPSDYDGIDNATAARLRRRAAEDFRAQLVIGVPRDQDERALQELARHLRLGKVQVKLFLRHPLHAKLYLCMRKDHNVPIVGYLGSSNLTISGLSSQGELNVDLLDTDACAKLAHWFEDRWDDRFAIDISGELTEIIDQSWARERPPSPFTIHAKIAYHLCSEARAGLAEFSIASELRGVLLEHQAAAVKIAARYLLRRGGVVLGDVVGLGKTLIAVALSRIMQDEHGLESLILCPKNLVPMWEHYVHKYRLLAKVLSISQVIQELPTLRRYRLLVIDESHNLRNRESKRYRVIHEYIRGNESRCILLSATPYNKALLDLSNQLRLFVSEDQDLGVRPERLIREVGELELMRRHQGSLRSLSAFEKSQYPDDWRELMALFMVRRTRSFIVANYGEYDEQADRTFLTFPDGKRFYFPRRQPKTTTFGVDADDVSDTYAQLQSIAVVNLLTDLRLPRYGLGNYVKNNAEGEANPEETRIIKGLSRAGKRLIGFCRTNFFKRLESSGDSFISSVRRHVVRNFLFIYALENALPLPIGLQTVAEFLSVSADELPTDFDFEDPAISSDDDVPSTAAEEHFDARALSLVARRLYEAARATKRRGVQWIRPSLFNKRLMTDLRDDAQRLLDLLNSVGSWDAGHDKKLNKLVELVRNQHPHEKVLVFTQFADTATYLEAQLKAFGIEAVGVVTGNSADPTQMARRFSPHSNEADNIAKGDELRVLVATDVLSEGQNLQDAAIVVNYDLPWAIIRLIQRAGRVDRIGQQAAVIRCYTFIPSDGVEVVIQLRRRLRERLRENAEVVGTDEAFFEDDEARRLVELYHENAAALDDMDEQDVDLPSVALQAWRDAVRRQPDLAHIVPALPNVVYSIKPTADAQFDSSTIVYTRTGEGVDTLALIDRSGSVVTESPFDILRLSGCDPDTPTLPKPLGYHERVATAVADAARERRATSGTLGRSASARFRAFSRLQPYCEELRRTLFSSPDLETALDSMYRLPLKQAATDSINRLLRSGASNDELASAVVALHSEDELCIQEGGADESSVDLICSLGLVRG